ncbi:hypothetical protein R3P38DRAFT_3525929 [Favolaschia claudopus]|uniref:Uncharacterized protein n=1 Tax=Favolaschia claudopus TaxID=2862362 RepID=A0AAW0BLD6_9AGAR
MAENNTDSFGVAGKHLSYPYKSPSTRPTWFPMGSRQRSKPLRGVIVIIVRAPSSKPPPLRLQSPRPYPPRPQARRIDTHQRLRSSQSLVSGTHNWPLSPVAVNRSSRSTLKDRLSGLFEFNALEGGSKAEEARRVNAAALEEGSMVPVVVEEKDFLSTYTAASVSPSPSVASVSSSSSSIGSILDRFEGTLNGPSWRCIMARSDEFSLRNNGFVV